MERLNAEMELIYSPSRKFVERAKKSIFGLQVNSRCVSDLVSEGRQNVFSGIADVLETISTHTAVFCACVLVISGLQHSRQHAKPLKSGMMTTDRQAA